MVAGSPTVAVVGDTDAEIYGFGADRVTLADSSVAPATGSTRSMASSNMQVIIPKEKDLIIGRNGMLIDIRVTIFWSWFSDMHL